MTRRIRPLSMYDFTEEFIPQRLALKDGQRCVKVHVEGYDDVAFWRDIFDEFESDRLTFEISVAPRRDLAKGKKVLIDMLEQTSDERIVCVDSDFDYLLDGQTTQSYQVKTAPYLFHSYAYSIENLLCYAPSLRSICTKATKNDMPTLDFEWWFEQYSRTIYPVFLWYIYSAKLDDLTLYKLDSFKNDVRIQYIDLETDGQSTIEWVSRKVSRRIEFLERQYPQYVSLVAAEGERMKARDLFPENTYLFMQGHTLFENVTVPLLESICSKLRRLEMEHINDSSAKGTPLMNALDNYRNSTQMGIRNLLLTNTNYKDCFLYKRLRDDIRAYVSRIL